VLANLIDAVLRGRMESRSQADWRELDWLKHRNSSTKMFWKPAGAPNDSLRAHQVE